MIAAVDFSDILAKLAENSTIGVCLVLVFIMGLKYLTRRDDAHNAVIEKVVQRMDSRDQQIQEAIECLREGISRLNVAFEVHRSLTENTKH